MQSLKLGLLSLVVSSFAFAGQVPSCFGDPSVVEGSFVVHVNTAKVTMDQLLFVLEHTSGRNLQTKSSPLVMGSQHAVFIETHAVDYNVKKLSQDELIRAVEAELQPIADIPGVTIQCNAKMYPA